MKGKRGEGPDGPMFFLSFKPSMVLHILIKENKKFGGSERRWKGNFGGTVSGFLRIPLLSSDTKRDIELSPDTGRGHILYIRINETGEWLCD